MAFSSLGLKYLTVTLGLAVGIYGIYSYSYDCGFDACNKEFTAYKTQQLQQIVTLEAKYHEQEKAYQKQTDELLAQVQKSKDDYNGRLLHLEHEFAHKLQLSEQRANVYKRLSSTSSSRDSLADYSARLDRNLTEGINLVRELRELVELRDKQLRQCGKGLKNMQNFNKSEGWDGYGF